MVDVYRHVARFICLATDRCGCQVTATGWAKGVLLDAQLTVRLHLISKDCSVLLAMQPGQMQAEHPWWGVKPGGRTGALYLSRCNDGSVGVEFYIIKPWLLLQGSQLGHLGLHLPWPLLGAGFRAVVLCLST